MKNGFSSLVLLLSIAIFNNGSSLAQDWPQFRGPQGNGVLENLEHPGSWGTDENVAWSVDMPGGGLSSPIVVDNRIILTTAIGPNPPVGPEMKIVATNQIDNDLFWSTPAISGKSLLIRGVKKLYCVRE